MVTPESPKIAVVGATGTVGGVIFDQLAMRIPRADVTAIASEDSAGQELSHRGKKLVVQDLASVSLEGYDLVLMSAGGGVSREWAPQFADHGAIVIDNSSAWRDDPEVPLVVSEVNAGELDSIPKGIVANPNCSTMGAMTVVSPLARFAGLRAFEASCVMAVSGTGQKGVNELESQAEVLSTKIQSMVTGNGFSKHYIRKPEVYPKPIAFNIIPQAGVIEDGSSESDEERKIRSESRKILDQPDLLVSPHCSRTSIVTGHSIDLSLHLQSEISPEEATAVLEAAKGVKVVPLPNPLEALGQEGVFAGRIRENEAVVNGLRMFISFDNLLKGAAQNAVEIAQMIVPTLPRFNT